MKYSHISERKQTLQTFREKQELMGNVQERRKTTNEKRKPGENLSVERQSIMGISFSLLSMLDINKAKEKSPCNDEEYLSSNEAGHLIFWGLSLKLQNKPLFSASIIGGAPGKAKGPMAAAVDSPGRSCPLS
ncbi:hypothetical protein JRQ81_001219 [Phrynocephalus forsythii]|uniref:Uncharacterized protein n=1 Tax=Phrynocephalus forsythii TaxID=171643 RepID=A0A9Q1B8V4_9SAUR|nr:hypothetical protein JRQ81_001219 [Phrynocephalus forsythii]